MTPPGVRRIVIGLAGALLAAVALVSGLGRIAGFGDVRAALMAADPWWLGLCAIGQLAVFTGYAGVVRNVATEGSRSMTVGESVRIVLATFAATQLFAFGGAVGLALLYWVLRRQGRERRDATVTLIGLNTSVYLVFASITWCAAVVAWWDGAAPVGMTAPWLLAVPLAALLATFCTAPRRVDRWTVPAASRARSLLAVGIAAAAWTRRRLSEDRALFGWAILYWTGDLVSLGAGLRAFGVGTDPAVLALAYGTGYVAQALPIPLIGTAGVDAATTVALHAVGIPLEAALLGVVAHRLFAFWLPIVPGIAFALTLPAAAWSERSVHARGAGPARA